MTSKYRAFFDREYDLTWLFFRKRLLIPFIVMYILAIVITAVSILIFTYYPDTADEMVNAFARKAQGMTSTDGNVIMPLLLLNNLYASGISVFAGFIPFIFAPFISLMANALIMGAMFSFMGRQGYELGKLFAAGILPHGIFEITALVLSLSAGVYLCYTVSRVIINRRFRKRAGHVIEWAMNGVVRVYLCYVVPLMCIAALIECYVTPEILKYVM